MGGRESFGVKRFRGRFPQRRNSLQKVSATALLNRCSSFRDSRCRSAREQLQHLKRPSVQRVRELAWIATLGQRGHRLGDLGVSE